MKTFLEKVNFGGKLFITLSKTGYKFESNNLIQLCRPTKTNENFSNSYMQSMTVILQQSYISVSLDTKSFSNGGLTDMQIHFIVRINWLYNQK